MTESVLRPSKIFPYFEKKSEFSSYFAIIFFLIYMKTAIIIGVRLRNPKKIIEITDYNDSNQLEKLIFFTLRDAQRNKIMKDATKSSMKFPSLKSLIFLSKN